MATRAKTAKARAGIACRMLKTQNYFGRCFDDCFEMGDGSEVVNFIIEKARTDVVLAKALLAKMPFGRDTERRTREVCKICLDNARISAPTWLFHNQK